MVDTVRRTVRSIDNAQPISDARELTDVAARSFTRDRFSVVVLATFACLAMLVATVGLYGLIAYTVKQRTNEIGVRLAFGAEPGGIERLVVKQGMQLVLAGLGLGLVGAILVSGGLSTHSSFHLTF